MRMLEIKEVVDEFGILPPILVIIGIGIYWIGQKMQLFANFLQEVARKRYEKTTRKH